MTDLAVRSLEGEDLWDAWIDDDPSARFVALYADTDIVTTYEEAVQPDGSRERQTVG